ncbi:DMT family transporter [Pseudaminobacter sp. NGMCC 1.201702]|uniref:DMT family transporter n=1 Tax=Pseudaminobacter sp. NGMCC 1.201702 TaxID=3391825 RepID=UPI0039F026F6
MLVALLNSMCYPFIALGLTYSPHLTFAALRAIVAGLFLAMIAIALRRPLPTDLRSWLALASIGLGATSFAYFGMFHAAEFVAPGLATVIANSQPLITAVLAFFFLSERLRGLQYAGLCLGFLGIAATSLPQIGGGDQAAFSTGLAYILLSVAGIAISNVLMKSLGRYVDPLVAMSAQLLLGSIPLVALALIFEEPTRIEWTPEFVVALLALALPGTALAYWLWFWLLGRAPLGRVNAFTFLSPVFALILGATFFGEHIGPMTLVGLILTALGVVIVERAALATADGEPSGC